jgi:hypothetical protein
MVIGNYYALMNLDIPRELSGGIPNSCVLAVPGQSAVVPPQDAAAGRPTADIRTLRPRLASHMCWGIWEPANVATLTSGKSILRVCL